MRIEINNEVDKKIIVARLMHVVQLLLVGTEVELVIGPDLSMDDLSNYFDKLSELTALAGSVVSTREDDSEEEWDED